MDTDKMMTYELFTMDDEKTHRVMIKHNRIGIYINKASVKSFSFFYKS